MSILVNNRSNKLIEEEAQFGAHNYHPLPVVLEFGEGPYLYDVDGKRYYDFLSGYSAVNQGHCHPRILKAMIDQAGKLTLTSRAFHSEQLSNYTKFIHQYFGYDKVLTMNTGVEAVETAIKIARKWAYDVKKIEEYQAQVVVCNNNFHGRTLNVISFSNDPKARDGFGPYMPGYIMIDYNSIGQLEEVLQSNPNICAFLVEPIQGEAGVIVPDDGYLSQAYDLCQKYNVLFMADEIQTGIGRTGKMLAVDHDNVRPDVLILGKALSGGFLPVSAVLADNNIMEVIKPGEHGSTYGGNPLACAVATEALKVIKDENMIENADLLGQMFRNTLQSLNLSIIKEVRGKGLLNAVVIDHEDSELAWNICLEMMKVGVLAKPTHGDKIRFSPPLVITETQLNDALSKIIKVLTKFS